MSSGLSRTGTWLFMLFLSGVCRPETAAPPEIPAVTLCELLSHSKEYQGRDVVITVRITAYKHGTSISDPSCSGRGADLQWKGSSTGTAHLSSVLREAGMSDHPVTATLKGTWMGEQHTDNAFIHQPRLVFAMSDASDIRRAKAVQRRR